LCKPYGRLYVNLDDADEFGTFIFRTTGFNSIRTLAARLVYYPYGIREGSFMFTITVDLKGQKHNTKLSNSELLRGFNFKGCC